ncbi:hypothetical protein HanXRQr2_Chr02g0062121 [Helianthus annuus]|uniref:Uncharacterized protein n=1 Tax=Helianthus annuus TaxID=4232 RepID=A0A9K3NZD3_HELAN|nr:hypothetical protein HanXRQr2_Chr02g0062121 [Helianthus annuus]
MVTSQQENGKETYWVYISNILSTNICIFSERERERERLTEYLKLHYSSVITL